MPRTPLFIGPVLATMAFGCGAGESDTSDTPTFYRDIQPITEGRCAGCHRDGNIAPFALTNYEEVYDTREAVAAAVASRTMPPWSADSSLVAYEHDPSLSDDQIALVERWVEAGAPAGDPADARDPLPSVTQELSRVDLRLDMPTTYTPRVEPDEYRCFVLDWPLDGPVYVTGFNANPGNPDIDHHIAAFLVPSDGPLGDAALDVLDELEGEDDEPGYECFGGPGGVGKADLIPAQQIGQWVPGQGGGDFPAGTGIRVAPGARVVLQMHYNLASGLGQSDRTTIELKLDATVEHEAAFAPWLDVAWVAGGMNIPAGEGQVVHELTGDPRGFFKTFSGDLDIDDGFTIHMAMLHMHEIGRRGRITVQREDGAEEPVLAIPTYDFHWQRLYRLAETIAFERGDTLTVECEFDNSAENQPWVHGKKKLPTDMNWGEGTGEEMCVGNLYISER
jgi:mono/diheme cytochrome c family protein